MLDQLQSSFGKIVKTLRGEGKITESNIASTMRDIRRALLEADVNYKVVKEFITATQEKALGADVSRSLTPGQVVVKIINDELTTLLGKNKYNLKFMSTPPTIIMLVGLQGCGKTTFSAKLANHLRKQGHTPVLVPVDVYRPAAVEQSQVLGKQIGIPVFTEKSRVVKRAKAAIDFARKNGRDTLIIDTAGRLHIDNAMMKELLDIKKTVNPQNILFVADGLTGQDAVNTATSFDAQLDFDSIVLTKMDSDARGGAALSIVKTTGKPIAFIGTGEKVEDLEVFHPDRIANRILGMGDIVSLVEKVQAAVDLEEAEKLEQKLRKSQFDLEDFLGQLKQMKKLGPMENILGMMPGMGGKLKNMQVDEKQLVRTEAIIQSMTKQERRQPGIINGSRRKRIANGSGTKVNDVNRLLNQFRDINKMMKRMGKMKLPKNLSGFNMGF